MTTKFRRSCGSVGSVAVKLQDGAAAKSNTTIPRRRPNLGPAALSTATLSWSRL